MSIIEQYFKALDKVIKKGIKPTLDAVAVEAGKKKGSIRRGFNRHRDVVIAIEKAAEDFTEAKKQTKEFKCATQLKSLIKNRDQLKKQYDNLLAHTISYIYQIEEQRLEILELREKLGEQVAKKKASGKLVRFVK